MNVPLWVVVPVTVMVALAARADVRTRKIPNALVGPGLLLGLVAHFVAGGPSALLASLGGMLVAGGILLPGYLLRWMGAGDVKLMAAVGAWVAFPQATVAVLAALVAGGVLSVIVALRHRVLALALSGAARLGVAALYRLPAAAQPVTGIRFPFALAIAAGTVFSFMVGV